MIIACSERGDSIGVVVVESRLRVGVRDIVDADQTIRAACEDRPACQWRRILKTHDPSGEKATLVIPARWHGIVVTASAEASAMVSVRGLVVLGMEKSTRRVHQQQTRRHDLIQSQARPCRAHVVLPNDTDYSPDPTFGSVVQRQKMSRTASSIIDNNI